MSLRYVGDGIGLSGFPARDLSNADLRRLTAKPYVRRRYGRTVAAITRALLATPLYQAARPAADESPSADGKE
jgi:hypothetical protein